MFLMLSSFIFRSKENYLFYWQVVFGLKFYMLGLINIFMMYDLVSVTLNDDYELVKCEFIRNLIYILWEDVLIYL